MNTFTKLSVCAMTFAGMFLASAETLDLSEKTFFRKNMGTFSVGEKQFSTTGMTFLMAAKPFDVDPAKKYTYKLTVNGNIPKDFRLYIGFELFSADGKAHQAIAWQGISSTFTQPTRDARKGDKVIYVKNAVSWSLAGTVFIALDAAADGSDLPNTKIIENSIVSKKKIGDEWEVTLRAPLKADIPAGKNIRQHVSGGYYYPTIVTLKPSDSGKDVVLTATIQGHNKIVAPFTGKTWPIGVAKAKFLILADWGTKANAVLTYKDASFTIE